jgi:predicted metal-dependent phosphoesterase TrpH
MVKALNADLHCHSTVSDGLLVPAELVQRARGNGVDLLALTDHDEVEGLTEAAAVARQMGLSFVNGVEISVSWGDDQSIHIVGLDFDASNALLAEGLANNRRGRDLRARRMAAELDRIGIHGAYEGALKYADNPELISRAHFARYIVELGHAREVKGVFDWWLAKGKPGYIPHAWASMAQAVHWISSAGGIAVLAHPGRYPLAQLDMKRLLSEFKDLGGIGIEVLSGSHDAQHVRDYANIARHYGFFASRGSDFHAPDESRIDLGCLPDLPEDLTPVWTRLF